VKNERAEARAVLSLVPGLPVHSVLVSTEFILLVVSPGLCFAGLQKGGDFPQFYFLNNYA
jgi:hypothetical protein